ncbi:MAG: hypothetical protein IPI79_03640 [Moraxellaceae bacterium]|nr:hypothetical protein [Moraxellaceae bacterium]
MNLYPDLPSAVRAMSRTDTVFYPNSLQAAFYQRCYQNIYKPWVKSLVELYAQQRLT